MKKILSILLCVFLLAFAFSSCSAPSSILRGRWDGQLYNKADEALIRRLVEGI